MAWEMKRKANTKIDGRSSFPASSFKTGFCRNALLSTWNLLCWIDVHCSYGSTRTERPSHDLFTHPQ